MYEKSRERLERAWVEQIFSRLHVRYGAAWKARWDGIAEDLVIEDWARELAGLKSRPDLLAYALDNLPADKPPTVGQFRAIANSRPDERDAPPLALDYKRGPIPAKVAQALDKLREPADVERQYRGPKGWAYRLRDREAQGDKLSPVQRKFWREALNT